ncbi:MAG: hypothetical protein J7L89_02680, partial [Bacteroidales bacterium]|nr:hypothetical protein [Bacteroidales bacterium]
MRNIQMISLYNRLTLRTILLSTLLLFTVMPLLRQSGAQDFTSSPYSRFGLGDLMSPPAGRNLGMGTLGIGLRSRYNLNLTNPASLNILDTTTFLLEVGGFEKITLLQTEKFQRTSNNMGFSYLALGFPVTKWWKASTGIVPYSGVGYKMAYTASEPGIGTVRSQFQGTGGVSKFFISSSVSPIPYLSLGATFSYLFGPLNHFKSLEFPSDSLFFSTQSKQTAILGGIHMSYGAQVNIPLKNNYFITLGGIGQLQSDLHAESRELVLTTGPSIVDTLYYNEDTHN